MATGTTVCGLNINANPHPEGVYVRVLNQASKFITRARASDYAKITKPKRDKSSLHLYSGRILVWTDINLKGRWLDIGSEDDLPDEVKKTIRIPEKAKPNYRTFDYVFDDKRHQFWFQIKNEFGETLGASSVERILGALTQPETLGVGFPVVSVSIIPVEGALQQILKLPSLNIIYLRINVPNADHADPAARQRVMSKLQQTHAQQLDMRLKRQHGTLRLTLTDEFEEFAQVAADTGFVRGEEVRREGKTNVLSTREMPKVVHVEDDGSNSFLARLLSVLHL